MIPLYGFLQGDTIGILVLGYEDETIASIREKLKASCAVRLPPREGGQVYYEDKELDSESLLGKTGLSPLDRFDVRWDAKGNGKSNDV